MSQLSKATWLQTDFFYKTLGSICVYYYHILLTTINVQSNCWQLGLQKSPLRSM